MASGRITFTLDGRATAADADPGESLLSVLRERLGVSSVKDGCAPQGQCGCCTVLVDGEPRVACVTPAVRVEGRSVTTVDGLNPDERATIVDSFVACGASQCGFCTPGIIVRAAWLRRRGKTSAVDAGRALAAHLCRCTGWQTILEAIVEPAVANAGPTPATGRALAAAARRAELEGGGPQMVSDRVPLGAGGFADDSTPHGALVAVPDPRGPGWVVGETLREARTTAGKVQGRRTTLDADPPLKPPSAPEGGVALATGWVEPAYLEPDASWCEPGGAPASPLANGGAFGGKLDSLAVGAARALAAEHGRAVRVVFSREDVVRLGPKRPPMAGTAVVRDGVLVIEAQFAVHALAADAGVPDIGWTGAYTVPMQVESRLVPVAGPPISWALRGAGWAEWTVLAEGALAAAGADRAGIIRPEFRDALLDTCAVAPGGAAAGARVDVDAERGAVTGVDVAVMAGEPLDLVVLRSYAIGAAHMALGWVLSESIAVDPATGEVHDLTIRSFGIIRARDVPPIRVRVVADPRPPLPRASDAVFAAVAAATWNAIAAAEQCRPLVFPARSSRAARAVR